MIALKRMQEVRTFTVKLICDCGGEYVHNGIVLTSNPPQYPHVCAGCGHTEVLEGEAFPGEATIPVGDLQDVSY
jgi:hypothetical protein